MIVGIGIDLCKIDRIDNIQKQHPEFAVRFLNTTTQDPAFLAKRWAAYEALAKALGIGLAQMGFAGINIQNNELGKPEFVFSQMFQKKLNELFRSNKITAHLSLTDETEYAAAMVILESI